jgi:hypothetical protein
MDECSRSFNRRNRGWWNTRLKFSRKLRTRRRARGPRRSRYSKQGRSTRRLIRTSTKSSRLTTRWNEMLRSRNIVPKDFFEGA